MYGVSWLLLATAVVTLLLGLTRDGLLLIYASIAASVLSMLFLLAAVIRRPSGDRDRRAA